MQDTKNMFSADEVRLMCDNTFFPKKHEIIRKTELYFFQMIPVIEKLMVDFKVEHQIGEKLLGPKIFKGENYLSFPYVNMDFPRIFKKENIFAFRTMFWWGHHFSFTIHFSGKYLNMFHQKIQHLSFKENLEVKICVHKEQWHHHFEEGNYIDFSYNEIKNIKKNQFLKLAVKFPINSSEKALEGLIFYKEICRQFFNS